MAAVEHERPDRGSQRRRRRVVAGLFLTAGSLVHSATAFVPPASPATRAPASTLVRPRATSESAMERGEMLLAGEGDERLLTAAFSALDRQDKYDAVLAGLCAKIVDGGAASAAESLGDPMRLMEEMTAGGIAAGPRGAIGLIDATALTSNARLMANVLSLAIQNGAIARYGSLQRNIRPLPRAATTAFAGGANDRLLDSVPPVPDDDRAAEVTQAFAFGAVVAACVGINAVGGLFGLQDLTFWTNLILGVAITTVVVDNFFDALVLGGSTVAKLNADKLPEGAKKLNAPTKEDMPLGIGTGRLTGTVVRGMSRLLSDNTERDCQCEAAAVFAAYGLGLPCFAFQPNALEGAALVLESAEGSVENGYGAGRQGTLDSLASDAGLLKVLIWLMAPVAMELSKHPQLMSSEPRESRGFLQRLADRSNNAQGARAALEDALPADAEQTEIYLRWALAEADTLLRDNARTVEAVSEALAGGAATVGDCVAVLEEW